MKIYVTSGIAEKMRDSDFGRFVCDSIRRHLCGDWGDVSDDDRESNDLDPENALSAYYAPAGGKIWVIQSGDIVTALFPWEY